MVRRRGQASFEYLFMITAALVIIAILVRTFVSPRIGTIHQVGRTINSTEDKLKRLINNSIDP